jgi:hypothetical protein
VKKSTETKSLTWFSRKVRQDCEGGVWRRPMYLATLVSPIWIPSLSPGHERAAQYAALRGRHPRRQHLARRGVTALGRRSRLFRAFAYRCDSEGRWRVPPALGPCPPPRPPVGAIGMDSGDVDQGRKMTVPVTELEECRRGLRLRSQRRERPIRALASKRSSPCLHLRAGP